MKEWLENPYKTSALIGAIFIVGMTSGSVGYKLFLNKKVNLQQPTINNQPVTLPTILEDKRETTKNAERFNMLLLGSGGLGHSGGTLSDSIIVVSVNTTDKKASLISIPRDLYFSGHKINADPSIRDAITAITGLPISNFISIDFISFVNLIDSLGGVEVDVKKAYTDNFYPVRGLENELCGFSPEKVTELHQKYSGFELEKQFICRYETIFYPAGINHMDGSGALKYVRSRHGGSDFTRSQHQFEVLKAILQKASIKNTKEVFGFVKTDLNLEKVNEYLTKIGNPLEYAISFINLSDQNVLQNGKSASGAYILIPKSGQNNYEGIKKYVMESI